MTQAKHKLNVLDSLRGVSAFAWVLFHMDRRLFAHGYLAANFFFMLSGFVMAMAYQRKLDGGEWSFRRFMLHRASRLYPLYVLGLLFGLIFALAQVGAGSSARTPGQEVFSFIFGLAFLPTPSFLQGPTLMLFPLDIPLWSLFFEMMAYAAHSLLLRRSRTLYLQGALLCAAIFLITLAVVHHSTDLGVSWDTLAGGFARTAFAYLAGLLVYRVWRQSRFVVRVPPLLLAASFLILLAVPIKSVVYELLVLLVVFPIMLLMGAYSQEKSWMTGACVGLGKMSYGVYVLHLPMLHLMDRTLAHLHGGSSPFALGGMVLVVAFSARILDRYYDVPLCTYLRRQLSRRQLIPHYPPLLFSAKVTKAQ